MLMAIVDPGTGVQVLPSGDVWASKKVSGGLNV